MQITCFFAYVFVERQLRVSTIIRSDVNAFIINVQCKRRSVTFQNKMQLITVIIDGIFCVLVMERTG